MRPILLAFLALVAGCAAPNEPSDTPSSLEPAVAGPDAPLTWSGRVWIPLPSGMETTAIDVPFELGEGFARLDVALALGSTLPAPPAASAMGRLIGPDGAQKGEAMMPPEGPHEGRFAVDAPAAGAYTLRVETWGASDGGSNGSFLDYRVDATPRQGFPATAPSEAP